MNLLFPVILVSALFQFLGVFDPTYMIVCALSAQILLLCNVIYKKNSIYTQLSKLYKEYKPHIRKDMFFRYSFIGVAVASVVIAIVIMLMISSASPPYSFYILTIPLILETIKLWMYGRISNSVKNDFL